MFCENCGSRLHENAVYCSECGTKIQSGVQTMNKDPEQVVMKGICNRVKSRFFVQNGKALLTNRRFIYLKHNSAKVIAIGLLVNLTQGDIDFEIPLSEIKEIEDARQGFSKTIKIHTKSGEVFHFYFTNRVEWKIALQNAIDENP